MNERERVIMDALGKIKAAEKRLGDFPWEGAPGKKGEHLGRCLGEIFCARTSAEAAVPGNVRDYGEKK